MGLPSQAHCLPVLPGERALPAVKTIHCDSPTSTKYSVPFKDKIWLPTPSYSQTRDSPASAPHAGSTGVSCQLLTQPLNLNPRQFFTLSKGLCPLPSPKQHLLRFHFLWITRCTSSFMALQQFNKKCSNFLPFDNLQHSFVIFHSPKYTFLPKMGESQMSCRHLPILGCLELDEVQKRK